MAPFPMRLWEEKYREPDVLFIAEENLGRCRRKYWDRADLVVEVSNESNRDVDLETKRAEYARAGIPEYWIVDPELRKVTVLALDGSAYRVHAEPTYGQVATSNVLAGFDVDVAAALDAE